MKKIIITLIAALSLAGCASVGTQIDSAKTEEIIKGSTTFSDIKEVFGEPYTVSLMPDRLRSRTWIYTETRNRAQNFIPVVGALNMKLDNRMQQLTVTFDSQDVVIDYIFNDSASTINAGAFN